MQTMNKLIPTLLLAAVAFSQLGATDCGQIITDPGFDLWCGDRMCFWKVEKGDAERVPTWIQGDDGVSLQGDDVAISQMTAVDSNDTDCIEFQLTANIAEDADVHLEADLFGDGTVDWSERIPTAHWEQLSLKIGLKGTYQGIKFRVTKQGPGEAVLADIKAQVAHDCPDFAPVPPRPDGASCGFNNCEGDPLMCSDANLDCTSNLCNGWVCSDCAFDTDCTDGKICGREAERAGWLGDWHACVTPSSRLIGERCYSGAECASGVCNGTECVECAEGTTCADGNACTLVDQTTLAECGPAMHARASGTDCVADDDCASGHCDGRPFGYCDPYGAVPCYGDADCGLDGDLTPIACTLVAVAGGTCR
jgi:hypothetical protein